MTFIQKLLRWYDESTARFQLLITLAAGICTLSTLFLFLTPMFNRDSQRFIEALHSTGQKPNIILIIVDALTAEDMSLYGYPLETTPNIEEFTKDWSIYYHAYSPSNCSVNIFPAIVTGKYTGSFCAFSKYGDAIRMSDTWVNLFEVLDDSGYDTWWTGYKSPGFYHMGDGIDHYYSRPEHEVIQSTSFQTDIVRIKNFPYIPLMFFRGIHFFDGIDITDDQFGTTMELLNQRKFPEPFFLYMHYPGVHGIEYPGGDFLGALLPVQEGLTDQKSQSQYYGKYDQNDQESVDKLRLRYDEAILDQDSKLLQMINLIKESGYYDSSMIVIIGDHGQSFNNGYSSHCTPLISYAESHVPLLIKYPNQHQKKEIFGVVSTIDLTPTFLDVARIDYEQEWFDGRSLLLTENDTDDRRFVFSTQYCGLTYRTAINNQYKFTIRSGKQYLYDIVADPKESNNLLPSMGDESEIVKTARQALDEYKNNLKGD